MLDLADRVQRVRLLLETLNDPYPTPQSALRPDSGPAVSRYLPCEACRRDGWVKVRGRRDQWQLCLICDGSGWKPRTAEDAEWDSYLELPLAEAMQLPRELAPARATVDDGEPPYGWERQRQAHDRHGSYQELRRQLSWLQRDSPRRYRLVQVVLVEHQPYRLRASSGLELELGVLAITLRMRANVRVPAWLLEGEARQRRETIESLAALGLQAGEIARRLGMTKKAVRRKLRPTAPVEFRHAGVPRGAT